MTPPRRTKAELLAALTRESRRRRRLETRVPQLESTLEAARREREEALEQQTATREILRVISSSPTDVQPVFDAIVQSAARVCGARFTAVFRVDDDLVHVVAHHDVSPGTRAEASQELRRTYPQPLSRSESLSTRAIVENRIVHVADVGSEPDVPEASLRLAHSIGYRSVLAVPMVREGLPIGTISAAKADAGPFSDTQIALLQTFAGQAVIAIDSARLVKELEARNRDLTTAFADQAIIGIENTRLVTELGARNHDLTVALDQQTATSEILRVISSSQTDIQPVFDAIVRSAVRLCRGFFGAVFRYDGHLVTLAAKHNVPQEGLEVLGRSFPAPPASQSPVGRAILSRAVVHIHDVLTDTELRIATRTTASAIGYRTIVSVPMLREGEPLGTINVARREVQPFSETEIDLLETFADQGVIAIENVRLFNEVQARTAELTRSVDELTALGDVGRVLSSTLDLERVLQTIVVRANQLAGTAGCTIWEYDEPREEFRLRVSHYADQADAVLLEVLGRVTTIRKGQGVTTQVMELRQPVQIPDIALESAFESPIRGPLIETGHRALLGVPLLREDEVIGVLAVTRKTPGAFEPEIVRLLSTFASQSALAIQNARLFLEIEDKSRQLEAASRHKSEFLANMSHELRTPLNAIIGFSEVLAEGMFGEINDKQAEYLRDILESGRHLLSLINDILDLSKIEAGRMELELTEFDLPTAIANALTLVRERAGRQGVALGRAIDERVGVIRADERKVKQVLLNLLSNALKFTPEGGRVDLRAAMNEGMAEISVGDTGVGIAPEDQEAVFEEFRQVGTANKKVEGTGLGLALSRKFIELHGGRIWVKSEVGVGSTFTFTLPVRCGE